MPLSNSFGIRMEKMIKSMWYVASLTALEARRHRGVPAVMMAFLIWLAVGWSLASVTMGSTATITIDFGLAGMAILSNLYAILLTIQLTQQERELRTLYVVLPRLPSRLVHVAGKFTGLAGTLAVLVLGLSLLLIMTAWILGWAHWGSLLQACIALIAETWIAIALAMVFSHASSLFLAVFYTLTVDVAGRFSFIIKQFGESIGGVTERLTDTAYYLLPNLEIINLRNRIVDMPPLGLSGMAELSAYALTEIGLLLCIAGLLFLHKDLQAA